LTSLGVSFVQIGKAMKYLLLLLGMLPASVRAEPMPADPRPNIVILYADDMGYGDLAIQNPDSKIPTPNLDKWHLGWDWNAIRKPGAPKGRNAHADFDSHDFLPYFKGATATPPRQLHVHNTKKDDYAIGDGTWLLVDAPTGTISANGVKEWENRHGYPPADGSPVQLFDMGRDRGQRTNLASAHPDVVERLQARLTKIRSTGHSSPRLAE
jgi:hypothetical protein